MNRKQRRANSPKNSTLDADPFRDLYNTGLDSYNALDLIGAAAIFKQILGLNPRHADSLHMLGVISLQGGHYETAIGLITEALKIENHPYFHNNLGAAYKYLNRLEEAMTHFQQAVTLEPGFADATNNLASALKAKGKLKQAVDYYRRAVELDPHNAAFYGNYMLAMIYTDFVTGETLAAAARQFGERIADPLMPAVPPRRNADPERRLRIGYISPDFRQHSVSYFFEPLLERHDKSRFEIFAYSCALADDAVTARLKTKFDHWRNITLVDDDAAARMIEDDRIDILIDLAGHTSNNRLLVLARKPAPVQATWLGFPATTGMRAIDYRITDRYADPEGMTEHLGVEKPWRLPNLFFCYKPRENSPDVIDHPPFEDNGYITFGFVNYIRVSNASLKAWGRIMERVPDSRLLLEIPGVDDPGYRKEVEKRLRANGLPVDRVILEPWRKENQYVLYNRMDIALDPFPANGGTTSMDTMWMGVPMITKEGDQFLSRLGTSILSNAGLGALIAKDEDDYVRRAVDLAQDRDRLRKLRHNMRDRVLKTPLMDSKAFARDMEDAYRGMWRIWCAAQEG
jgi:predicted O-linked N-acetylglucosamine transferase (SPINDLY family)